MTALRAGAGRATIELTDAVLPLDQFTRVLDPLEVRVLVIDGAARVVWAVLDQTSLRPDHIDAVSDRLCSATGAEPSDVIVQVSHTFSAPHLGDASGLARPEARRMTAATDALLAAVDSAAAAAVRGLRVASLAVGHGRCDINVNRDVELPDGWGLGINEAGLSDKTVTAVRFDDEDGTPIAILANYAVQPSVLDGATDACGGRVVSADLAGIAMRGVEAHHPGCVAMFVIAAAGDQAPHLPATGAADGRARRPHLADHASVEAKALGQWLAASVIDTAEGATPVAAGDVHVSHGSLDLPGQRPTPREEIAPTREHDYAETGAKPLPYVILTIGALAMVGVQVELSAATGIDIRAASPFAHTVIATMVNGAAKYLPPAGAFDRYTYEALSSPYQRGGAEHLTAALDEALAALTEQAPR